MVEFCKLLQECQIASVERAVPPKLLGRVVSYAMYGGLDLTGVTLGRDVFEGGRIWGPDMRALDSVDMLGKWLSRLRGSPGCKSCLIQAQPAGLLYVDEFNAPQARLYGCLSALYGARAPHWSQVLWCDSTTTLNDVVMFFERVRSNEGATYTLVAPNQLAQQLWDVVGDGLTTMGTRSSLVVVFTRDCSLKRLCPQAVLGHTSRLTAPLFTNQCAPVRVVTVHGGPGDGKTFHIQTLLDDRSTNIVLRINEGFSVDNVIEQFCSHGSLVDALSARRSVTVVLHVSAYSSFPVLDAFLFRLVVLGAVAHSTSGQVVQLMPGASVSVIVEVPVPVDQHDTAVDKQRQWKLQGQLGYRERTVGRVDRSSSAAQATVRECPCVACVSKFPGYAPENGCAHLLPALNCVPVDRRDVPRTAPYEISERAHPAFVIVARMINAFFTPIPASWRSSKLGKTVPCADRFLTDATVLDGDRGGTALAANCETINFDVPSLDPPQDGLQELLRQLHDFLSNRDAAVADHALQSSKRQLTFFLSYMVRPSEYLQEYLQFNETHLTRGSILFEQLLRRSLELCDRRLLGSWALSPQRFIILRSMHLSLLHASQHFGYQAEAFPPGQRGRIVPVDSFDDARLKEARRLVSDRTLYAFAPNPSRLQGDSPELAKQLADILQVAEPKLTAVLRRHKYILIYDVSAVWCVLPLCNRVGLICVSCSS